MNKTEHASRVRQELIAAGATTWGLLKLESRHLPEIIHEDEHIGAMVYGHYKKHESGMLVATNKRIIFIDRKPLFYSLSDELTYEVVSGVSKNTARPFSSITLHTRLGDYKVRLVNERAADKFVHYIEAKRIESKDGVFHKSPVPGKSRKDGKQTKKVAPKTTAAPLFTADEQAFLLNHEIVTLSTISKNGEPRGSVMYYVLGENNFIYLITKSETNKIHNILSNADVALTIFDIEEMQVLQIDAQAEIEKDNNTKHAVFQRIIKPRRYGANINWPPVTKIKEGAYVVIRVSPTSIKFTDYR